MLTVIAVILPPYCPPMKIEATMIKEVSTSSEKVIGNNSAIASVPVSPGIAANKTLVKNPMIMNRKLFGTRTVENPCMTPRS